ncbi:MULTISPECIES: YciI family protein [unclassified Avibacterium]|uniref:YciI family protein n=1 Tax=unclassified Avibacterium TaxID=2685287 RepID=UPI002026EE25|nr:MULTISPECIES: YciI family protein [unclassified Avibacterium]MCW9699656.1 YciI family protein [Avibacterium sp. 20-129]MCW9733319.1 YciI family protein [Avibacterium sp. 20-15]URL03193.1 YciI family protein [Avibacterium sp. 20-132]URL06328.1 YciI family protein [Avibacterium sp. 21-595]
MFLVQISLDPTNNVVNALLEAHRVWLKKYAETGVFLLFGPYADHKGGVILAQVENKTALQKILAEDVFFHKKLADYQVREFTAKFIANALIEMVN